MCGAAPDQKRNVGTDFGCYLGQIVDRKIEAPETVQSPQRGGCVRRSTTKSSCDRDAFLDIYLCACRDARFLSEHICRPDRQVDLRGNAVVVAGDYHFT